MPGLWFYVLFPLASFQEAIRIAQEAKLLLEGEERVKLEINIPGLEAESSSDASLDMKSEANGNSEDGSVEIDSEGRIKIDVGL